LIVLINALPQQCVLRMRVLGNSAPPEKFAGRVGANSPVAHEAVAAPRQSLTPEMFDPVQFAEIDRRP
jgi:hypothetical protein